MNILLITVAITFYIFLSFVMGAFTLRTVIRHGFIKHPYKRSWHDGCGVFFEGVVAIFFWWFILPICYFYLFKEHMEKKYKLDLSCIGIFFGKEE